MDTVRNWLATGWEYLPTLRRPPKKIPKGYDLATTENTWLIKCATCKEPVTVADAEKKNAILALGVVFHANHLICSSCHIPLDGLPIYAHPKESSRPLCQDCSLVSNGKSCAACRQPLMESAVFALKKYWHRDCFKCKRCNNPMQDKRYYVMPDTNLAYDEHCFYINRYRVISDKATEVEFSEMDFIF